MLRNSSQAPAIHQEVGWASQVTPRKIQQNQPAKGQEAGESGDPFPAATQATPALPGPWPCLYSCPLPFPAKPPWSPSAPQNLSHTSASQQHGGQETRVWLFDFLHSPLERQELSCKVLSMWGVWSEGYPQRTGVHFRKGLMF